MSELETTIRQSATIGEWAADWDDVLRRSGHKRYRSRRAAAIATITAVAVVLLLPGIGIGGGLNALISPPSPPGLQLAAELYQGSHLIGTVSVRPIPAVRARQSQIPPGQVVHPRPTDVEFRWNVDLTGAANVSSLRILDRRSGRVVAQLCSPCKDGAQGTLRRSRLAFATVFGRGTVIAETSRGTAKGTLRLVFSDR